MRLEECLPRTDVLARIKLKRFVRDLEALDDRLQKRGHAEQTVHGYMRAAVHLVHCLGPKMLPLSELDLRKLRRLVAEHQGPCRYRRGEGDWANFRSVAPHFFQVMRERHGLKPDPPPAAPGPVEQILTELDQHLRDVQGLQSSTRERYERDIRRVLSAKYGAGPVDFGALTVADVREWVGSCVVRHSPRTTHALVTALRSLFRYLSFRGEPCGRLGEAVPAVPTSRLSGLPGGLDEGQFAQLVAAIDVSTPIGLRAHAIVQCLGILGLRAGEVANLELKDVDWRAGTIQLRATKTRRAVVLPLPALVGRPLAAYLKRGRPKTTDRHLFVRHYYPVGKALHSKDVTNTVRRAMWRAGLRLPSIGAHVLRHTAATRLLRAGAKMKDIADLLGHRDIDSTSIYAKVDWPRLAEVALPWPRSRNCLHGVETVDASATRPLTCQRSEYCRGFGRRPVHWVMGPWEARVREYLDFRRRLGFSLRTSGDELVLFAKHLESTGHVGPLTVAAAVQWTKRAPHGSPRYWACRMWAIRAFAKYLAATDPSHEVPPLGVLGRSYVRCNPHIYSPEEIGELLDVTRIIRPVDKLPPRTFRTFFGLLAATGVRCGEALSLKREHVDLRNGRLVVAKAKLGKSRVVPLHPTTTKALSEYAARRDRQFPRGPKSDAFFLSRRGTALSYERVTTTFRYLRRVLRWTRSPVPRVHDLRHTFAVRNLIRWTEAGDDVDNKIATLATYLGHVNVTSTYWYFSAVPELMAIAGRRFEGFARMGGGR